MSNNANRVMQTGNIARGKMWQDIEHDKLITTYISVRTIVFLSYYTILLGSCVFLDVSQCITFKIYFKISFTVLVATYTQASHDILLFMRTILPLKDLSLCGLARAGHSCCHLLSNLAKSSILGR